MKILNKNVTGHSRFGLVKGIAGMLVILLTVLGLLYWYNPYEKGRLARDDVRIRELKRLDGAIKTYLENNDKSKAETCDSCTIGKDIFATGSVDLEESLKVVSSTSSAVNITGWVPVDFSLNARIGETPIKVLPIDPSNIPPYVYTYTPGKNGTYKLSAALESTQNDSMEKDDLGINDGRYELGNDLQLPP